MLLTSHSLISNQIHLGYYMSLNTNIKKDNIGSEKHEAYNDQCRSGFMVERLSSAIQTC